MSRDWEELHPDPNIRGHYWTNAIMHGGSDKDELKEARKSCRPTLQAQIEALSPKIIIVNGQDAADSLYEIGLLQTRWSKFNQSLAEGVYFEETRIHGAATKIFCTYHTAAGVVNRTVFQRYTDQTESQIDQLAKAGSSLESIQKFKAKYANVKENRRRSMMVLLLHWLAIGEAIREANGS